MHFLHDIANRGLLQGRKIDFDIPILENKIHRYPNANKVA